MIDKNILCDNFWGMNIVQNYRNLMDKCLPIGGIVRKFPYALVFKTTHWCMYNCAHCCENAGTFQPRKMMPAQTIKNYIVQAVVDPQFSDNVVFTGGEIMSAYHFGDTSYVPDLLNFCAQHDIGTDIKTNASWVNTSFAPRVFDDLTTAIRGGQPYNLQISLSLDRYHSRSVQNCAKFIHELSKRPGTQAIVHMSTFENDKHMFYNVINALKRHGTHLTEAVVIHNGQQFKKCIAGDGLLLDLSTGTLFDGGRAHNIQGAYHDETPQFSFMSRDGYVLMAFDSFGRVTLGENSGRKINTKWCHKSGTPRTLTDIKHGLIRSAQFEDMRYRILHGGKRFTR